MNEVTKKKKKRNKHRRCRLLLPPEFAGAGF